MSREYPVFDRSQTQKVMNLQLTKEQAQYMYQLKTVFENLLGFCYEGGAYGEINSFGFVNDLIRYATWWWSESDISQASHIRDEMRKPRGVMPRDHVRYSINQAVLIELTCDKCWGDIIDNDRKWVGNTLESDWPKTKCTICGIREASGVIAEVD